MKYEIQDQFKPFVAYVKRMCKINKVELMLSPSKTVVLTDNFSADCSGYFDGVDRVLAVACGKPFEEWIEILIHEFAHMQQWLTDERWPMWIDNCLYLWDWLDKAKMMNNSQLNHVIDNVIELERDCEVRALGLMDKWKLPVNRSRYKRRANLYLYSYRLMPILKKFPTGIYYNESLVSMCPPRMLKKYNKVPEVIKETIIRTYM
jgi:hypothetical protein